MPKNSGVLFDSECQMCGGVLRPAEPFGELSPGERTFREGGVVNQRQDGVKEWRRRQFDLSALLGLFHSTGEPQQPRKNAERVPLAERVPDRRTGCLERRQQASDQRRNRGDRKRKYQHARIDANAAR